ncbi:YncE family protein [Acidocella sp.]|uniref:YncE family protein n=1 Tax=Acidocella sp. TaxID=50710 RepID=UPI0026200140|nr:YncE family protein [Acidocella sp.]
MNPTLAKLAALALMLAPLPAAAQPLYHLAAVLPLSGATKWDYLKLDKTTGQLFISHGDEELVVNPATRQVVGRLAGLDGSHGVAFDPATGNVWADSAGKSVAIAFAPQTLAPLASVPVLDDADGMAYDPASKTIFVSGGDGHGLTPINPATRTAYPTIALGSSPEAFLPDGRGNLYVAMVEANEVARVDTLTRQITARWPTTGCLAPTGLALDEAGQRIFVSCRGGTMDVLDERTGRVIVTLPIGMGTDGAAFDPVRQRAFSANGAGTISVIDTRPATPRLLATLKTKPGARTLAVDPASGDLYTVTAKVAATIPPATPHGRAHYRFVPGTLALYVYAPSP